MPDKDPQSKLIFYTEMIKLNREEARALGILWVYILIGLGASALANVSTNLSSTALVGINLCLAAFAFFYMTSIHRCFRSIKQASKGLQQDGIFSDEELRGYSLLPRQIARISFFLSVIPVAAMIAVMLIIMLR